MRRIDLALLLLAACGDGSGLRSEPDAAPGAADAGTAPDAGSDRPEAVTPFGTPTGTPVSRDLGAAGGSVAEPRSGASLRLRAGSAAGDAHVTLQPIENTLPGGVGEGVLVTLDGGALSSPAIIELSYGDDIVDPAKLRIALQLDDGSWVSLFPVKLDRAARTVSASVPQLAPTAKPQGAPARTRLVHWQRDFFMRPARARLRPGGTVTFTPYATGEFTTPASDACEGSDDQCLPPLPPRPVPRPVPFTNDKPAYIRTWYVDTVLEGDERVGTARPGAIGALYTAPATRPTPSTVMVEFISTDQHHAREASARAPVEIVDDCTLDANGLPSTGCVWAGSATLSASGETTETHSGSSEYFTGTSTETQTLQVDVEVQLRGTQYGILDIVSGSITAHWQLSVEESGSGMTHSGCTYTKVYSNRITLDGHEALTGGRSAGSVLILGSEVLVNVDLPEVAMHGRYTLDEELTPTNGCEATPTHQSGDEEDVLDVGIDGRAPWDPSMAAITGNRDGDFNFRGSEAPMHSTWNLVLVRAP